MRQHFLVLQQARNRVLELATEIEGVHGRHARRRVDGPDQGRDADGRRVRSDAPTVTGAARSIARAKPAPTDSRPARRLSADRAVDCVTLRACIAPCPASCCARRCCRWRRCGGGRGRCCAIRWGPTPSGWRARRWRARRLAPARIARSSATRGGPHSGPRRTACSRACAWGRSPTGRRSRRAHRPRTSRRPGRVSKRSRARCWTIPSCARARGCASRRRRCAAPASSAGSAPARRRRPTIRARRATPRPPGPPIRSTKSTRRSWSSRCPPSWRRRSSGRPGTTCAPPRARTSRDDPDDVDELLLTLVDDGLLHSDLAPPIVGARGRRVPARAAGRARRGGRGARARTRARRARGRRPRARRGGRWPRCRANGDGRRRPRRAGPPPAPARPRWSVPPSSVPPALAPLLVRLQDALAPPAAERFAQPALADALDAATELYGGGAFDVAALGDR